AGHVFLPGDPVDEREMVAGVLTGPAGSGMHAEDRSLDFFDAKGAVEALLEALLVRAGGVGDSASEGPFHPGRSAAVLAGGRPVGVVGELHPRVAEEIGLGDGDRVALFEVDLSALSSLATPVEYREIPRFPPVRRDLAF